MGQDDDLNASLAHVVLCCVAGRGISRLYGTSYTYTGMHSNLFVHGFMGILHFQSGVFDADFAPIYGVTLKASRYLPIPCLMADIYKSNTALSTAHLVSGLIPLALAMAGQEDAHLGNLMVAVNIISLAHYSFQKNLDWGWYTVGAALFTYFGSQQVGPKVMYPLGLALMEYFAYRVFWAHIDEITAPPRRR